MDDKWYLLLKIELPSLATPVNDSSASCWWSSLTLSVKNASATLQMSAGSLKTAAPADTPIDLNTATHKDLSAQVDIFKNSFH